MVKVPECDDEEDGGLLDVTDEMPHRRRMHHVVRGFDNDSSFPNVLLVAEMCAVYPVDGVVIKSFGSDERHQPERHRETVSGRALQAPRDDLDVEPPAHILSIKKLHSQRSICKRNLDQDIRQNKRIR
jgi:hypothetical protein